MNVLDDYILDKRIIIVGTGVGKRSSDVRFYYANLHSNCMWDVLIRKGWVNKIPDNHIEFTEVVNNSEFGFTDLVKDYSGSDNKVLLKYYRLNEKGKLKIHPKFLSQSDLLEYDKKVLIDKLHDKDCVIINGKPLMKILSGGDTYDYGEINNNSVKEKIGIRNSKIIFIRNSVMRNGNQREEIIAKILDALKTVE
jgi:hypothetical protein